MEKTALLATKVTPAMHARFHAAARSHGGASHLLRTFVEGVAGDGEAPDRREIAVEVIQLRLSNPERLALREAAAAGMPAATWARCALRAVLAAGHQGDRENAGPASRRSRRKRS